MGYIKLLLSLVAFYIFLAVKWISLPIGADFFWSVALIFLWVIAIGSLFYWIDWLIIFYSIPALCSSFRLLGVVLKGILKYFFLYFAAHLMGFFEFPWIFGPMWIQAIVIGVVFLIIGELKSKASLKYTRVAFFRTRRRYR